MIFALWFNQSLNLSVEQWDYLIKKSDLKQLDYNDYSPLMFALSNKTEINLTKDNWKYFIENSDLFFIQNTHQLRALKKIQSELISDEILNKIDITEDKIKVNKV